MWKKITHTSEGAVNLLSLALLLYISLAMFRSQPRVSTAFNRHSLSIGQTVSIKNLDWTKTRYTLVFALQSGCHFCAASAPFYRELLKRQTNETDPPGTKSVRVDRALRGSPVNIVGLFEANRDVAPFLHDPALASAYPYRYKMWDRVLFQADDDWLANLVIAVKTVSNKEIVAGSLDVTFPQMGSGTPGDPTVCQAISLGRMPEHSLYATHDGHKVRLSPATPITIKPGQEMRFAVLPNLGAIKESIGSGFPSITAAQVTFDYVYFSDGTRWAEFAGFQKPETSVPGKYVPMTSEEFNGQTAVN